MSDFDFATLRVAIGGAIVSPEQARHVKDVGITHVIDCWQEEDHTEVLASLGIAVLRCSTLDDGSYKPMSWFERGLLFALDALRNPDSKVLAHCCGGINRGPSMGYAILRAQGQSPADAELLIRNARPVVQLRYIRDADEAVRALGLVP